MAKRIKPIHPGEILNEEFLAPFKISQYRLAKDIGLRAVYNNPGIYRFALALAAGRGHFIYHRLGLSNSLFYRRRQPEASFDNYYFGFYCPGGHGKYLSLSGQPD